MKTIKNHHVRKDTGIEDLYRAFLDYTIVQYGQHPASDEMCELFKDYPEAIENTVKIAESCNIDIPMGELFLPNFPIPKSSQSKSADYYLQELYY